jgi:hypothetical protein
MNHFGIFPAAKYEYAGNVPYKAHTGMYTKLYNTYSLLLLLALLALNLN